MKLAFRTKFLDFPQGDPIKIHKSPIPLLGGVGITLAIFSTLFFGSILFNERNQILIGIGIALGVLFLMGLYDDYKSLSPNKRLIGQFIAALIVISVSKLSVGLFPSSLINQIITILYLMALINAMNLLDGIDGLATGITLLASIGFLLGFIILGNSLGILISLALIGASAGFLIYNFAPARIFLGDNGSTVLGFLLGICAVLFSSKPGSIAHFVVPILILIVPVFDTALTIIRRFKKRMPLLRGDREHLYDHLLSLGLSQRQTTVLMYCFGMFGLLTAVYVF